MCSSFPDSKEGDTVQAEVASVSEVSSVTDDRKN